MFGYIRICKPELKIKEYETYKAIYCSLCKNLGKNYNIFTRFTLSYDFTFLALLDLALKDDFDCFEKKHCVFNPFKKCVFCKKINDLDMSTAAAIIMTYYKIKDNVIDEKGIKKFGFYLLSLIFKSSKNKAAKKFPEIEIIISEYIKSQTKLEKENLTEIDIACEPTATALSKLLMLCHSDQSQKRILERLGYCLGRYIYLLDAACDLEIDIKKGNYNCLKNYGENVIKDRVEGQLYFCVNEAARAFELLDIKKYKTILGNILYLGLEETFKKELKL